MKAKQACEMLNEALEKDSSLVGLFQFGFHTDISVSETKLYCEMSTRPNSCFVGVLSIVNAMLEDQDEFLVTMSGSKFVTMRN